MKTVFIALMLLCVTTLAQAEIARAQLTSGIINREPADSLPAKLRLQPGITKLYFFTQVTDSKGKQVIHRWLHEGEVKAEVTLNIGSENWRTYSSKDILPTWKGQWLIQVEMDGQVVTEKQFELVQKP